MLELHKTAANHNTRVKRPSDPRAKAMRDACIIACRSSGEAGRSLIEGAVRERTLDQHTRAVVA
jgi:hypothetical protein